MLPGAPDARAPSEIPLFDRLDADFHSRLGCGRIDRARVARQCAWAHGGDFYVNPCRTRKQTRTGACSPPAPRSTAFLGRARSRRATVSGSFRADARTGRGFAYLPFEPVWSATPRSSRAPSSAHTFSKALRRGPAAHRLTQGPDERRWAPGARPCTSSVGATAATREFQIGAAAELHPRRTRGAYSE